MTKHRHQWQVVWTAWDQKQRPVFNSVTVEAEQCDDAVREALKDERRAILALVVQPLWENPTNLPTP